MRVVGYISTYKIHDTDISLETKIQKDKIVDYCKRQGYNLLKIYEEPKESRPDYKPALISLINDAKNKEFDCVIVLKLDRFGLESSFETWVISELKKCGTDIYSLTESQATKSHIPEVDAESKARIIKQRVKDIPSLPEVVTRVIELVQNPKSSAAQLSKVIAHDPGLTSRVLRLVNSAYYGFPKQISSIQHAIMILGFTTMRGLVLSSSIFKIFVPKTGEAVMLDYKKFWKHYLITAISAKIVNQYLQFQEEDDLFSAAILHDIGKIILDQYDHENYIKVVQQVCNPVRFDDMIKAEIEHCGVMHPEIGFLVAEGWNLPEKLSDIIRYHHFPYESNENKGLSSIIYLGNILSHIIIDPLDFDINLFDPAILDYLSLDKDDLLTITSNIIEEIQGIDDLESFFK